MNIVWTTEACPYCDKAKALLDIRGIDYETRLVDNKQWTINDLKEAVPAARSYPQVILNNKLIGGCDDLEAHLILQDAVL